MGITASNIEVEDNVNNVNVSELIEDCDNANKVNVSELIEDCDNVEGLIDIYYNHYPDKYYLNFPEFCVNKLKLDIALLHSLSPKSERTRDDIRDWCKRAKLTYDDIIYVGW